MSYPRTSVEDGIRVLQHHDKSYEIPIRHVEWAGRVIGFDPLNRYIFDDGPGIADNACNVIWPKGSRETSAYANVFPAVLSNASASSNVSSGGASNAGPGAGIDTGLLNATTPSDSGGLSPSQQSALANQGQAQFGDLGVAFGAGDGGASGANQPDGSSSGDKGGCGVFSGPFVALPLYDDAWSPDSRFNTISVKFPDKYPKMPINCFGIMTAGTYEYDQKNIFLPIEPRLFAVNFAGDPLMGTQVHDLTSKFEIDPDRGATLQSAFRVLKKPLGHANAIAIQLGPSGCGDTEGGYVYDKGQASGPSGTPTGGNAPPGTGRGAAAGGGDFIAPTGFNLQPPGGAAGASAGSGPGSTQAQNQSFVIGVLSVNNGGFIDVGSEDDKHNKGQDADGTKINSAHISTKALFRKNKSEDGPIRFEDTYFSAQDLQQVVPCHLAWTGQDWAIWTTTNFIQVPQIVTGLIPIDPINPIRNVVTGIVGGLIGTVVNTASTAALNAQGFISSGSPVATGQMLSQGLNYNGTQLTLQDAGQDVAKKIPISGAMSALGAQGGQSSAGGCGPPAQNQGAEGDPHVYTQRPGSGRFSCGTSSGGWVFHPPETSLGDQSSYGMMPPNTTLSNCYVIVAPNAWFGAGTPQLAIGGVTSGWSWGMDTATADLIWRTHVSTSATPTIGIRFIQSTQQIAWYAGTANEGILNHANTSNRTYTFPDASGKVPVQIGTAAPGGGAVATNATVGGAGPVNAAAVGWRHETDATGSYWVQYWN